VLIPGSLSIPFKKTTETGQIDQSLRRD